MPSPAANVDVATVSEVAGSFVFPARLVLNVPANSSVAFVLARNDSLLSYASMFESLALEDARVTVHVGPSQAGSVGVCFHSRESVFSSAGGTQVATHSTLVFAATDSVNAELILPKDHSFGRELRGMAIGNSPPTLHVVASGYPGNGSSVATVILHCNIRGSGIASDPVALSSPATVPHRAPRAT